MCGLWGGHSDRINNVEAARIYALGFVSLFRGTDSTGMVVGQVHKNKLRLRERREVAPVFQFLSQDPIKQMIFNPNTRCVVGHSRAATHGTVNLNNAHPIHEGHIIGTHNGTIDAFKPAKGEEDNTSDTRVLFQKMAKEGVDETLKQAKDGAWACVWIDTNKLTLNMVRNLKRPLWIMEGIHRGVFYWASEERMLEFVAKGENPANFHKPYLLKTDTHYSVRVGSKDDLEEREIKALKVTTSVPVVRSFRQSSDKDARQRELEHTFGVAWESEWEEAVKNDVTPFKSAIGPETKPVLVDSRGVPLLQDKTGETKGKEALLYRAGIHGYRDIAAISAVLNNGCTWCSKPCDIDDDVYWLDSSLDFVCEHCIHDPIVAQYEVTDLYRSRGELVRRKIQQVDENEPHVIVN